LEDIYTPWFSVSYTAYLQQGGHRSDTNATFSWTVKSCTKIKLWNSWLLYQHNFYAI